MTNESDGDSAKSGYASPPCMAHEVDPGYFDPMATDPQQSQDVAVWRQAERQHLRAKRMELSVAERGEIAEALMRHLDILVTTRCGDVRAKIVSGYWPIKGEPDLRPWLGTLHERGAHVAMPLVETRAAPLVFRRWHPGMKMERGHWNIPVPPASSESVVPDVALAPLVGWDAAGFRLGYGGGYFDRTLAALPASTFVIGVGFHGAQIPTIYPQPHDIRMSVIVTEAGVVAGAGKDARPA